MGPLAGVPGLEEAGRMHRPCYGFRGCGWGKALFGRLKILGRGNAFPRRQEGDCWRG